MRNSTTGINRGAKNVYTAIDILIAFMISAFCPAEGTSFANLRFLLGLEPKVADSGLSIAPCASVFQMWLSGGWLEMSTNGIGAYF